MLATVAGILAALAITLFSLRALHHASGLQDQLNRGHALAAAAARLTPLLEPAVATGALDAQTRYLVRDAGLGFTHLVLRGADGAILATDGRFEQIAIPLLTQVGRQSLRAWLYRVTSERGRLPLRREGLRVGELEYAIAPALARDVREQALRELRIAAWAGLLLALPTLAALALMFMRRPILPDARLLARSRGPARGRPQGAAEDESPEDESVPVAALSRSLRAAGLEALDTLGYGLIVVDREARIRLMNRAAVETTGWSAHEALGRLVYSVFHPLDEQQAPLVTPAETCLREGRAYEPTELWVRSRDASVRPVEVMAALLREQPGAPPTGAAMVFHDIAPRREALERLRRESRLSLGVIDHLVEGVLTTDPAGVVRFANTRALRMFGYSRDELDGVTVTRLLPVPFLNTPGLRLTDYIAGRHSQRLPKVVGWRKDATTFPVELVVQPMQAEDADGLVVIVRDITERMRSDNLVQRFGRLLDAAANEVYIFDAQSLYFVEVNRGARRNLGYAPTEIARLSMLGISRDLESDTFLGHLARLRGGEVEHAAYRARHVRADGSDYPVEVRLSFSREEEPPMFMAIAADITDREAQEDRLRYLAHHDPLTGLPNRITLLDRLRQALLTAARSNRQVGVFFVDLDRFKHINDAHGHEVGDVVLELTARRLQGLMREVDTVARLGGDEFVVVAQGLRGIDDAEVMARKIIEVFEPRFEIPDYDLRVTPSVGVALYPLDESDAEGLLRHADAAMYQAKQSGAGQYRLYSVEVSPQKRRRLELDRTLHAAFALQQFEVEAIPAFVIGSEPAQLGALLLDIWWRHPRQGRITGREVMAAAGRSGLLGDVELWALHRACALLPQPPDESADEPPLPVVVNVSGWQLRDVDFSRHLFDLMERHRVPPRRLILALDRVGLEEVRAVPPSLMRRLLERGLRFALRGNAQAVFEALGGSLAVPLDLVVLEADGDAPVMQDPASAEPLRLALLSAKGADLRVLATGVSSGEAREWLQAQGCGLASGPQFAPPVPAAEVPQWLAQREAAPV